MQKTDEGKKCSAEHWKEMKDRKKAKYGKKHNISLKDFEDIKNSKHYKSEMKNVVAKATEANAEADEKTDSIASLLRSEVEKQVINVTSSTKSKTNPTDASSDIEFKSALGSILKSKDKGK